MSPPGAPLAEVGAVISNELDIVPAKIRVIRRIRKQYACGHCIKTARPPRQRIPNSLAAAGLLGYP